MLPGFISFNKFITIVFKIIESCILVPQYISIAGIRNKFSWRRHHPQAPWMEGVVRNGARARAQPKLKSERRAIICY